MPRLTKDLPFNRADWTFGHLIYWHVLKYGTRPSGDPARSIGEPWEVDEFCIAAGIDPKTLGNWILRGRLPDRITRVSNVLFGNGTTWNAERRELFDKLEAGQAARRKKRMTAPTDTAQDEAPLAPEPPAATGYSTQAPRPEPVASEPPSDEPSPGPASPEPVSSSKASHAGSAAPQPARSPGSDSPRSRAVVRSPAKLPGQQPTNTPSRRVPVRAIMVGVAVMLGIYGWVQSSKQGSGPANPKVVTDTAPTPFPKPDVAALPPQPLPPKPSGVTPVAPPVTASAPSEPTRTARVPEPVQPPPEPTEEEKKQAREREEAERLIAVRKAAHDAAMGKRDEDARRLDEEAESARNDIRQREEDARTLAGLRFSLRENTSVPASPFGNKLVASVADCALACIEQNCDAFGFYRDQLGRGARGTRYCYFFRKPYTPTNYPGYQFGEVVAAEPAAARPQHSSNIQSAIRLAQASGTPPVPADDLTRCAGGPVKVTGFQLACDRIMDGGTTLGSTPLRYTLANINECAAKCRPVRNCTAFTFNSGDPPGRHSCIIFGGKPEARESAGWIAGTR